MVGDVLVVQGKDTGVNRTREIFKNAGQTIKDDSGGDNNVKEANNTNKDDNKNKKKNKHKNNKHKNNKQSNKQKQQDQKQKANSDKSGQLDGDKSNGGDEKQK